MRSICAFAPDGHTLTVVVDREEMSANSGRDTIFDWHCAAQFQPEQAAEHAVVSEPGTAGVEGHDESVGVLQVQQIGSDLVAPVSRSASSPWMSRAR